MKKIIIIKESFEQIGGVDNQVIRIARELKKKNFLQPVLVTSNLNNPLPQAFLLMGLEVYEIPLGNGLNMRIGLEKIYKLIDSDKEIAYIQSHLFRESIFARFVKKKYPKLIHIFRAQTYIDCMFISSLKKLFYHLIDKFTSQYVDHYVGNGVEVAKEIVNKSWIPSEKVSSVYNGCEPLGVTDYRTYDNLPVFRIAMIANLWPKKGHDVLIKGLAKLKMRGMTIHCRIIGDEIFSKKQNFHSQLTKMAEEYGVIDQIEFYGYTSDVYSAIKEIPVIVLPSDSEGIPNSILEAMSLRKLVVASNVGGISLIIRNGENGFLHPPQNPEKFAEILWDIFDTSFSTWDELRNNAYKDWKEKFSIECMIDGLIEIYSKFSESTN